MADGAQQSASDDVTETVVRVLEAAQAAAARADEFRRRAYGAGDFKAVEFFRSAEEREREIIAEAELLLADRMARAAQANQPAPPGPYLR